MNIIFRFFPSGLCFLKSPPISPYWSRLGIGFLSVVRKTREDRGTKLSLSQLEPTSESELCFTITGLCPGAARTSGVRQLHAPPTDSLAPARTSLPAQERRPQVSFIMQNLLLSAAFWKWQELDGKSD